MYRPVSNLIVNQKKVTGSRFRSSAVGSVLHSEPLIFTDEYDENDVDEAEVEEHEYQQKDATRLNESLQSYLAQHCKKKRKFGEPWLDRKVASFIAEIYTQKTNEKEETTMTEFIWEYFLRTYGIKNVALQNLNIFSKSVQRGAKQVRVKYLFNEIFFFKH